MLMSEQQEEEEEEDEEKRKERRRRALMVLLSKVVRHICFGFGCRHGQNEAIPLQLTLVCFFFIILFFSTILFFFLPTCSLRPPFGVIVRF